MVVIENIYIDQKCTDKKKKRANKHEETFFISESAQVNQECTGKKKKEKNGMSMGTKIGIGVGAGAVALVAGGLGNH